MSCVFFYKVLSSPNGIIFDAYFSDVIATFLPYKTLVHAAWQGFGQLPMWNPYTFMGLPAVGNTLFALFNPSNILYMFFNPAWLFGALMFVDVFIIGVSTYFFVKEIGVNRFGALVAAITFMFSGVVIARVYAGHPVNLDVIAMIPLSFLLVEKAIQKKSLFYGALTGIPIALELVGGNIEISLYGVTALALYFALRLIFVIRESPKHVPKTLALMVVALVLGVALSAVQFIPAFELSLQSVRNVASSVDYQTATAYSFPPEQTMTFLIPEFYGTFLDFTYWGGRNFWELCVYTGVFSLVLVVVALIDAKNKYKLSFLAILAFSILFVLGRYTPFYSVFYYMPFFNMFRKPSAMLFLTAFSLSVLAGFGADFLSRPINPDHKKRLALLTKILAILSIFGIVGTISTYVLKDTIMSFGKQLLVSKYQYFTTNVHTLPYELEFYMDKIPQVYDHILFGMAAFIATLGAITVLLHLHISGRISMKYFQLAVVAIILVDLWWFGLKYVQVIDTAALFNDMPAIDMLKSDTTMFRVLNIPGAIPDYMISHSGLQSMTGYEAVQLLTYQKFMGYFFGTSYDELGYSFSNIKESTLANNTKILGLLNVKYVLTGDDLGSRGLVLKQNMTTTLYVKSLDNIKYKSNRMGYIVSNETTQLNIYENPNLLPRAFVVRNAEVAGGDSTLAAMAAANFDPKNEIILEENPGVPLVNPGSYTPAEVTYYSPNEIRVHVDTATPGFLVLSENYYPGWSASDNGKDTQIYRADYVLRSVYLGLGEHDVVFTYYPLSFKIGALISSAAVLFTIAAILYETRSTLRKGVKA